MEPVAGAMKPDLAGLKQIVNQVTGIALAELSDDLKLELDSVARIFLICEKRFGIVYTGGHQKTFGDIRRELKI